MKEFDGINKTVIPSNNQKNADKELEQLLNAVERAGRNSRRQQQLSELIDSLAADEKASNRRNNRRVWSITISAAACIALFVTTIVKLIGTEQTTVGGPLTAEVNQKEPSSSVVYTDTTKAVAPIPVKRTNVTKNAERIIVSSDISSVLAENVVEYEEENIGEQEMESDTTIDSLEVDAFYAEQQPVSEEDERSFVENDDLSTEDNIGKANVQPMASNQEKKEKEPRKWFQLRRANPSKMDGTMLAFNIL